MLFKLLRYGLYSFIVRRASALTGVRPHYKVQYSLSMLSPYWLLMRRARLWLDRGRCQVCGTRGEPGNRLQLHHLPGTKRLQGWGNFWREVRGCEMRCDRCHSD